MSTLNIAIAGHVARVTLNRPDVRNAFNEALIAELTGTFNALGERADLRAIVLAAEGKAFCAGADLNWMKAMAGYSWDENHADASKLADMLWALYSCPVPVIARVQGDVYAGGVGLVACADIVVAVDTAGFCLSEAKLGLLPATIGPYVVKALGEQASRRYFVTAERFAAAEAKRLGLVHEVVAADALDAKVDELVAAIAANGPAAARACKRLVKDVASREITPALRDDTARRIADIRASEEGRAGVQSFLAKTPPPGRKPDDRLHLAQAQADMRLAYWHGAFGVLASALAWSIAAGIAAAGRPQQAVWALLIGGMFIFPVSMVMAKLAGRRGMHEKTNPLGRLAMFSTFGLVAGCALALAVATQKLEWFFPTMLLVIGLRYLVFTKVYGLRIYQACGLALAAAGLVLGAVLAAPSPELKASGPLLGAVTGALIEVLFGILLLQQGRTRQA